MGAVAATALLIPALAAPAAAEGAAAGPRFVEVGAALGARRTHHTRTFTGPYADALGMFTAGGAAVAVGDYDGDGDDDLFVTDSERGASSHLLRNELVESGELAFTDVTAAAGVGGGNEGDAIVADALWLDADGDGREDLLIVRFGTPLLYRNLGGGRFADVTAGSGLDRFANSIAAIAFDADADGDLDLLLGHYFPPVDLVALPERRVLPDNLDDAHNGGGVTFWRNETPAGSSAIRFSDRTAAAGFAHHTGWTLDLGHGDVDDDGDQDVYLAGDYGTDRLFLNRGDGTFEDVTERALGFDTRKGMNVDFGDWNRDGRLDVYVTNITDEYMRECNFLWTNEGGGRFTDLARETGSCDTLWGWAAKFGDLDNDGWQDLFVVNGLRSAGEGNYIPVLLEMILRPGVDFSDLASWPPIGGMSWSGYQRSKLLHNRGGELFTDVAAAAGVDDPGDGRGLGLADFDRDGRLDLYVTNAAQPSLLYRNVTPDAGHWLAVRLVGTQSNRSAIGARLTVTAGGVTQVREVDGGNGYAGQSSRALHVGLGAAERVEEATVRWPSGLVERFPLAVDRFATLREGEGEPMPAAAERLWHHRNLGKAFYENPATQYEAVDELAKVVALAPDSPHDRLNLGLALLRAGRVAAGIAELQRVQAADPALPHTWFNLGIAAKRDGRNEEAIAQLERFVALVPGEPIAHFNLGVLHRLAGDAERALAHFEAAARGGPELAGPRYQLYNAYRAAGRQADAERELAAFRAARAAQEGAAVPEDLEWNRWAELLDEPEPAPPAVPAAPLAWRERELARGLDPATAGLALVDADGDGGTDLLAWSTAGVSLYRAGEGAAADAGLDSLRGVVDVAVGDFDDDGLPDLAVVRADGAELWRNGGGGRFARFPVALPAGSFRRALWLDFDHDYDVDLFLLGATAALLRNPGGGLHEGWVERTAAFPFVAGDALAADSLHVVSDTQGTDLVVAYRDRLGVVYRDRLGGRFEAASLPELPAGSRTLLADDADADGWVDLLAGDLLLRNRAGEGWEARAAGAPPAAVLADVTGDGRRAVVAPPRPAVAALAADLDGDRRVDLAAVGTDGTLRVYANATPGEPPPAIVVRLEGVKNRKLPTGAEVEVKAGSLYQKQVYRGVPLHFALGGRASVDAVRITWPNGLIQNEARQPPGSHHYREAPRLSGSCPMVFAWDGTRFAFVTDVLGVAPLGAAAGEGEYFPVDHDEVVQIPRGGLAERDGRYELRITEELREVAYLDLVRLVAVDHPPGVEVFVNDQFRAPPFPEHRLVPTAQRHPPVAARDDAGRDVLARVLARDRTYPDGFRRSADGVAERHHLDLDFGAAAPDGEALLVLHGWVDWADGSTFLGLAQRPGGGLAMPRLLVRDETGAWVTAFAELGIPAGKPKTIVVDLTGKWRSSSREVRIESELCLYWDEVFLAAPAPAAPLVRTELAPEVAELRFRGFARPVIHPERLQPESFDYHSWSPTSMWNPTPGLYTRYGDVRPLLDAVDDQLVVMGSGDELRLSFDAGALPPLPAGWRRDFLVAVDGWAKDGDANTAFSQTVEPLPFRAMSRYPFAPGEEYPDTPELRRYRETWNTRPALRLLRPLRPEVPAAPPAGGTAAAEAGGVAFTDVTAAAGIDFVHENGAAGGKLLPETMGAGVAFFDADGDGWLDLLFVNGRTWDEDGRATTAALYRNRGDGTFADVTAGSGLDVELYGLGVAVADADGDGRPDVYLTALEGDRLFRNLGGGRFADVTAAAGIANRGFGTSAAWLDYDRDGLADLFVANYVDWSPATDRRCSLDGATRSYCTPQVYPGVAAKLWRNRGDGSFEDASETAGVADATRKALGVAVLDHDGDGWPDLFVANDTQPNQLLHNRGDGTFADIALEAGVAYSDEGKPRGAMGVDAADYDRSGTPDVLVGNFSGEGAALYRNEGEGLFTDAAARTGIRRETLASLTFGAFFFDHDLDGWLDVFLANGHIDEGIERVQPGIRHAQGAQLFRSLGGGRFAPAAAATGPALAEPRVARGAAHGDYDRDGDLDVVLTTNGGPAVLLRNDGGNRNHWLRVRLAGRRSTRDGLGAVVRLTSASGTQQATVRSGSSYCSHSDLAVTFGLGADPGVDVLEVIWPSGVEQRFTDLEPGREVMVDEEAGIVATAPAAAVVP